jgi:hypothetical protein
LHAPLKTQSATKVAQPSRTSKSKL